MIGDGHNSGILAVIKTCYEIILVIHSEPGGWIFIIFIPAYINIIGDGPWRKTAFAMTCRPLRTWGKYDLVAVIDLHCNVGKTKHRVHHWCTVDDSN